MASGIEFANSNAYGVLDKTTLMHDIYRALLLKGRTYAAFEYDRVIPLIERLKNRGPILDPMSGYGTLMSICSCLPYRVDTCNVECNIPSYYWQLLVNPNYIPYFISLCDKFSLNISSIDDISTRAKISTTWFVNESFQLFRSLWMVLNNSIASDDSYHLSNEDIAVAFLLPFVARLSCYVQGDIVTHVKKGGLCVFVGWKDDLRKYVSALRICLLNRLARYTVKSKHEFVLADARYLTLSNKYDCFITSPPYPNGTDYNRMFAPENAWIEWMVSAGLMVAPPHLGRLIGSPIVSEKNGTPKKTIDDLTSPAAIKFIKKLASFKGSRQAIYNNEVYYLPYFCNYFHGLQEAYENIARNLADSCEGYIIAINNTARKMVIPVAESIIDIWRNYGFNARIDSKFTREVSHVGGLNPDVKGFIARHTEYTIRVTRNG